MIKRIVLCFLLVALAGCGVSHRKPDRSPMHKRVEAMFNEADVDHDEWLTREELAAGFPWLAGKYHEIDTDDNGKVSLAETQSHIELSRMLPEPRRRR